MGRQKRKMKVEWSRKISTILLTAFVICAAAGAVCGCGMFPTFETDPEKSAAGEEEDLIVIGYSQLGSEIGRASCRERV